MSDVSPRILVASDCASEGRAVSQVLTQSPDASLTVEAANSLAQSAEWVARQDYSAVVLHPKTWQRVWNELAAASNPSTGDSDGLRQENQRLTELYETAYRFVDNVSHEFRTPLTVIKEFAAILRDGLDGVVNEQQREHLDIIAARADDLAAIVNDMFELSQLEAGKLAMRRTVCLPERIVERVRDTLRRQASRHGVSLVLEVQDDLPLLYCDPEKGGRVIVQLVDHLLAALTTGANIAVRMFSDPENWQVIVEVADDGSGRDEQELQSIKECFKQSERQLRTCPKGLDRGLNIAKDLIHLNLGEIGVESQLGVGTTFRFTIPVADIAKVSGRYLERLRRIHGPAIGASLIAANIDPNVSMDSADDVDQFLQQAIRCNDLVFRLDRYSWLMLTAGAHHDVNALIRRVQQQRDLVNRNRPGPALPEIQLGVRDQWAVGNDSKACSGALERPFAFWDDGPRRILLVDDDRDVVEAAAIRLQSCGFDVYTAYNGDQAVKLAVQYTPDAILLDICMPVMDGLEALTELRNGPKTRHIPVAVMSGRLADKNRAMQLGASYFIEKPYETYVLMKAVEVMAAEMVLTDRG